MLARLQAIGPWGRATGCPPGFDPDGGWTSTGTAGVDHCSRAVPAPAGSNGAILSHWGACGRCVQWPGVHPHIPRPASFAPLRCHYSFCVNLKWTHETGHYYLYPCLIMWTFVVYELVEKHGHLIFCDQLTDLVLHFESHGLDLVCSLSWLCKIVSHEGWDIFLRLMNCDSGIL